MKNNIDKNLIKILELYENGKSTSDILMLFPENQKEIKEILEIIKTLEKNKKEIMPSKELLKKIVTQIDLDSYLYRRENVKNKGRSNLINQIHEYMSLKWKIGIPVGIVIIALGIFAYNQLNVVAPNPIEKMVVIPEVEVPKVTANIDNAVDALILAASEEQAIFESELSDAALLGWDDSALSDFGQTYDENLF
jgi:hypothetical protein